MTQYVMVLGAHAMDHIPGEDVSAVANAAHAVCQEAINAGVWVLGGGLANRRAIIVAADGTVSDGLDSEALGGVTVVEVPSRAEALMWAAKFANACRCAQEVWEIGFDPELDAMLREADSGRSCARSRKPPGLLTGGAVKGHSCSCQPQPWPVSDA